MTAFDHDEIELTGVDAAAIEDGGGRLFQWRKHREHLAAPPGSRDQESQTDLSCDEPG